jgi:hypothetical protein
MYGKIIYRILGVEGRRNYTGILEKCFLKML